MKKILSGVLLALLMCSMAGCIDSGTAPLPENPNESYHANPVDSMNYSLYVDKEITLVLNAIEMHMANSLTLRKGTYAVEDEIKNLEASLQTVQGAIESVKYLAPPKGYDDVRTETLRRMANAKVTLEEYKGYLQSGDTEDISSFADTMQGDFISLKGLFNVMSE